MKRIAVAVLLLAAACKQQGPVATDTTPMDTREPIAVRYVGAPELAVREQANDTATVLATYQNGEAIPILTDKGEWVEVRTGERSGWAKAADLTTAEGKEEAESNPQPKFRVVPLPVSAPSTRGEIYLEADVNTDGEVTAVRILENSTGSEALAMQNMNALKSARFYPIVQDGERKKFKYYHRVTY
ncbi:MAG TPA: TonB family protein [Thermoanaerobaculia bacterium]|nr:TonB family protein [Thermoanaerobaculia bacterium]